MARLNSQPAVTKLKFRIIGFQAVFDIIIQVMTLASCAKTDAEKNNTGTNSENQHSSCS